MLVFIKDAFILKICDDECDFISQSPAVDVVGVGTATGRIIIHNIRLDETLMSFTQDWGPISSLAFRTGDVLQLLSDPTAPPVRSLLTDDWSTPSETS